MDYLNYLRWKLDTLNVDEITPYLYPQLYQIEYTISEESYPAVRKKLELLANEPSKKSNQHDGHLCDVQCNSSLYLHWIGN
jgi:hypothetical protein